MSRKRKRERPKWPSPPPKLKKKTWLPCPQCGDDNTFLCVFPKSASAFSDVKVCRHCGDFAGYLREGKLREAPWTTYR